MHVSESYEYTAPYQPPEEMSGPFRVSQEDFLWLRQELPVLDSVLEVSEGIMDSIERDQEKIQAQSFASTMRTGQPLHEAQPSHLQEKLDSVIRAGSVALSALQSDQERYMMVRDLLEPYFGYLRSPGSSPEDNAMYETTITAWSTDMLRATKVRAVYENGSDHMQVLADRLAGGPIGDQYRMLKIFADQEELENEEDGDDTQAALLIMDALHAHRTGSRELSQMLAEQLAKGAYDQYVARDLLRFIASDPASSSSALKPVAQTYGLVRKVALGRNDEEIIDDLAYAVADWTPDMQSPVRLFKESLEASTIQSSRMGNYLVTISGLTIPADRGERFAQAMREYVAAQSPGFGAVRRFLNDGVAAVNNHAYVRRTQRIPLEEAAQQTPEVVNTVPRRLLVTSPDGAWHERGSDRFNKVLTENITVDRGSRLGETLDTILNYMSSQLDFSQGMPRGVNKYDDIVTEEGRQVPVYGFKPKDARGLSAPSRQKGDIRILFKMLKDEESSGPEAIEILAVAFRDKIGQEAKKLGVRYS